MRRRPARLAALLLLLGAPLGCATATAQEDQETARWLAETFPADGRELLIDLDDADVVVRNGDVDTITFEVWFRSGDLGAARDRVERMNFRAEDDGRTVSIESDELEDGWSGWSWRRWGSFDVWVEATVPATIDARIVSGDGDVSVQQLSGAISVFARDGDVMADALDGSIELRSEDGDLGVRAVTGTSLVAHTDDGDVTLGDLEASRIQISTNDGDIQGKRLNAASSEITSNDGDIIVDAVSGEFTARTGEGDIHLSIDRLAATSIDTGEGDITIRVAPDLRADLDLRGSGLSMRAATQSNFNGDVERRRIEGTLNGGGPALRAHARDGTIILRLGRESTE